MQIKFYYPSPGDVVAEVKIPDDVADGSRDEEELIEDQAPILKVRAMMWEEVE